MGDNLPALPPQPIPRDLVKEIAMDIGKEVAAYIERMYPEAVSATSSTFLLSLRNCTYNQIMAALATTDAESIARRLVERKRRRREQRAMWKAVRNLRPGDTEEAIDLARNGAGLAPDL